MIQADQLLQAVDLRLLLIDPLPLIGDLLLLLFDRVDEQDINAFILDAFDFTFAVVDDQQRFNFGDVFSSQSEIGFAILFPIEGDGLQPLDQIQPRRKRRDVGLIAQAR